MNIAFVTEMGFFGKLPKNFKDFKTVESWIYGFDATNIPFNKLATVDKSQFDLFIVIVPKKNIGVCKELLTCMPLEKTAVMQEGPCYYFQDFGSEDVLNYELLLSKCKFLLCHNDRDTNYFRQFNPVCVRLPTCCDTHLKFEREKYSKDALMFGTLGSWYNGQTSYRILKETGFSVWMPQMGRFKADEGIQTTSKGIKVMAYSNWFEFMESIKNVSVACHMMPTVAASSYAINCAMLGIPCICAPSDIAWDLFPMTTCRDPYDFVMGSVLAKKLVDDKQFYLDVVNHARLNLAKYDYRYVCPTMIRKFTELLK